MRSLLIVRGDDSAALDAALASEADAIVIALDVGEMRDAARRNLARLLSEPRDPRPQTKLIARVSGLSSGETDADLDAAMACAPWAILLPGCAGAADVQRLSVKLAVREASLGLEDGATRVIAMIDAARAVLASPTLVGSSGRLAGIAWDAEALCRDLGAETSRDATGGYAGALRYAREATLLAAAAARVPAIDAACPGDSVALAAEVEAARRDGFRGKLACDPAQAALINRVLGKAPAC